MWTTYDGGRSETSHVSVGIAEACKSPFLECNVSINGRILQWNTFHFHSWGIYE
jgi:hypothetical protein